MNLAYLNRLVDEEVALNAVRERHPAAVAVEACLKSDRRDVCRLLMDMAKEGVGGIDRVKYAESVRRVRDNLPEDGTDLRARLTRLTCGLERHTCETVAHLMLDVWTAVTGAPTCTTEDTDLTLLLRPNPTRAEQVCALGQPTRLSEYRVCDDSGASAREPPSYHAMVLDGADFSNGFHAKTEFDNSSLRGANFSGSDLAESSFRDCDLTGASFKHANLSWARMMRADLRGANLTGADVTRTFFNNADLRGAVGLDPAFKDSTDKGDAGSIQRAGNFTRKPRFWPEDP